jgi:hypothetical protein
MNTLRPNSLVDRRGIEPRPEACKATVLPLSLSAHTIRKHIGKSLPKTIAFALLTPVISYSLDLRFNSGMQTPFGLTDIHPQRYWAMCLLMVSCRGNDPLSMAYQAIALPLS